MNSKKKNKNRQNKSPNPIPPQTQEVSYPLAPEDVTNAEIGSVIEERVPNIVSEIAPAEIKDIEESPKKPKRNRGKKKKDDEKIDKEDEIKSEELAIGIDSPRIDSLEGTNITPTARKKKNKNKKGQGTVQEEKVEERRIEEDALIDEKNCGTQEQPIVAKEEPEHEMKSTKKKNKKKKNRNDSERSDKAEDVSCTSAFQKLLSEDVKVETIAPPPTDESSISEATVKEVEIVSQSSDNNKKEMTEKNEGNKNKKKNKNDKKPQTVPDKPKTQMQSEDQIVAENFDISSNVPGITSEVIEETIEIIPSCSTSDDTFKYKAKITKPMEKKKKGKFYENIEKIDSETKFDKVEELKVSQIEPDEETAKSDILLTEDLDDVILVPLTEITPDWHEEVKIEEGNGPVIGCEEKNEITALEQPCQSHEKNENINSSPKLSTVETPLTLPSEYEISTSSRELEQLESAEKTDIKSEIELEDKKMKNIEVKNDNRKKDTRKKSPKPQIERAPEIKTPSMNLGEMLADTRKSPEQIADTFEKKVGDNQEIDLVEKIPPAEDKLKELKVSGNVEINIRKKSPKRSKKDEMAYSSATLVDVVQPELTTSGGAMLPPILKPEDVSIMESTAPIGKKGTEKDEAERVHTPDSVKRQKIKKSPKPFVDISVASGSKSTQKSKQNILNIENIIIIQAEVVSEEKAHEGDSFVAIENSSNKKDCIKTKDKHEPEKSKKRKKSPKPPQREPEIKCDTAKDCVLVAEGEILMPVTPKPQDMKILPEAIVVELETPKVDSPSEVTPDFIEHPRCSSEQLDSNNNMVIQEIQQLNTNLSAPVIIPDIPMIQSTNISSPELVPTRLTTDSKVIEEKTDLKSKVLEVNQDMEELRMSIERSLAELTSLEKSERGTEKDIGKQNTENDEKTRDDTLKMLITKIKPASEPSVDINAEDKQDCKHPVSDSTSCKEPVCPARKDHKGKGKSKKKGKQEPTTQNISAQSSTSTTGTEQSSQCQNKNEDANKSDKSSDNVQGKEKQQTSETKGNKDDDSSMNENIEKNNQLEYEPIENFEEAMTSSVDDVNKTFEIIANEVDCRLCETQNNPEINVTAPQEDDKNNRQEKQNPVSQPKNLLGHPDIPVPSSRTDYKKEKNKPPNCRQAKVKIKDANQVEIEIPEKSQEVQMESKRKLLNFKKPDESICVTNQNEDYIYKYSFRKVFLQCACHVCKKDLKSTRVPCSYCNLIFYCNQKHKDDDYSQHQALCFAVSTIVHLKDQKFIYTDSRNVIGHNYRLLRMQMIVSCEKVLKRKLTPWEQEALLYPRMCALPSCREWRQGKLVDCEGCGQISYCLEHPDHLPKSHSRWCKSYNLYRGLVKHQQTKGRLEPKLPTRVLDLSPLPQNINEVLAAMYEEKIEMNDIEYAALTQLATAPLTALFCLQHGPNVGNVISKKTLTLHIVGAELQFEADVLNKWEVFLLHLLPNVEELRVMLVGPDLNPSNLPLDLLGKIRSCENCQRNKRIVVFGFQDKRTYHEFWASEDFSTPDLVCAFNPSIQRSSAYNGKDTWPATINCILKLKSPLAITSYTLSELTSDLLRVQECATVHYKVLCPPRNNSFASVRPDRNFITDDEAPLLFKNYCVTVICGV